MGSPHLEALDDPLGGRFEDTDAEPLWWAAAEAWFSMTREPYDKLALWKTNPPPDDLPKLDDPPGFVRDDSPIPVTPEGLREARRVGDLYAAYEAETNPHGEAVLALIRAETRRRFAEQRRSAPMPVLRLIGPAAPRAPRGRLVTRARASHGRPGRPEDEPEPPLARGRRRALRRLVEKATP
jgi:hypothetical protein